MYLHTDNKHFRSKHLKFRAKTEYTDTPFAPVTLTWHDCLDLRTSLEDSQDVPYSLHTKNKLSRFQKFERHRETTENFITQQIDL